MLRRMIGRCSRICQAANRAAANAYGLIAGPNGSGKTTSAVSWTCLTRSSGRRRQGAARPSRAFRLLRPALEDAEPTTCRVIRRRLAGQGDPDAAEQLMRDLPGSLRSHWAITVNCAAWASSSGGETTAGALAKLVPPRASTSWCWTSRRTILDLWACEALEQALLEFEGTCIVVSHDRYFLNRVIDLLLVLDGNGNVQVIHGNYDTYELMQAQQESGRGSGDEEEKGGRRRKSPHRRRASQPGSRRSVSANFRTARRRRSRRRSPRPRQNAPSWSSNSRRRSCTAMRRASSRRRKHLRT